MCGDSDYTKAQCRFCTEKNYEVFPYTKTLLDENVILRHTLAPF